ELQHIHQTLGPRGRVFIFVPALQWLLGSFDKQIGHHRRYTKSELEQKCKSAGFQILKSGYFDLPGVVPWWIKYCVLRSTTMEAGAVRIYDRYFVPVIRRAESVARPPLGKNVFVIAEKVDV
ncbi:MAG TPA: hypothetical protein VJT50_04675, partial [Pyrinomonadaceae bacterium]|nr:hypothetical protein [Pyrinomonadaceae bacterium]